MQAIKVMAPSAIIEVPDGGLYQVSLFPELMQAISTMEKLAPVMERRGLLLPGSFEKRTVPNKAYSVVAVERSENLVWQRVEDVFSKLFYASVAFVQDEQGYRAHTVMIQSCNKESKEYYRYNDAEVNLRIRDRAKLALTLAQEDRTLESLADRFEHMKQAFSLELD